MNYFKFLLSFLMCYAVDPEDGGGNADEGTGTEDAGTEDAAAEGEGEGNAEGEEDEGSLADKVWKEIQADKEKTDVDAAKPEGEEKAGDKEKPADQLTEEEKAAKAEADAEAKKITDDDLKPLNSKNPATNERFTKLTEGYKDVVAKLEDRDAKIVNYEASMNSLRELGFNDESAAEDLVNFAGFRHILATGDVEGFKRIFKEQVQHFEELHGVSLDLTNDPLEGFDDLKQKVKDLDLSKEDAIEMARHRRVNQRAERNKEAVKANQQTGEQQQQAINEAATSIETWQNKIKKTDADYGAVMPILLPQMQQIAKNYPANQWMKTIQLQYDTIKASLISSNANKSTSNNEPLRSRNTASSTKVPETMAQAALQEMGFDID